MILTIPPMETFGWRHRTETAEPRDWPMDLPRVRAEEGRRRRNSMPVVPPMAASAQPTHRVATWPMAPRKRLDR